MLVDSNGRLAPAPASAFPLLPPCPSLALCPPPQEYSAAGQFTLKGRIVESIKQNLIFYGAIGVCAIGFLIWIVVANGITSDQLTPFMFTLATTFGLVNIVLMMGYGLVEVPRMVWRASNPHMALRREHFKAPDLDQELFDSRCVVEEIIAEVQSVKGRLPSTATPEGMHVVKCYETLLAACEAITKKAMATSFRQQRPPTSTMAIPDEVCAPLPLLSKPIRFPRIRSSAPLCYP